MKRNFIAKIGLFMGSTLVALFLAEIGLRFAGISYEDFNHPDPVLGISPQAGAEGWYTYEGKAYIKINSDGLRDVEHQIAKPDGVYRVAVLGDSFMQALQVPLDEAFHSVLQASLLKCSSAKRQVEVINFGVNGYSPAQQLLLLRHSNKVWKYQPDLVLLAFFTLNDISDSYAPLRQDENWPYFKFVEEHLVLDESYQKKSSHGLRHSWLGKNLILPLLRNFRLGQVLNYNRGLILTKLRTQKSLGDANLIATDELSGQVYKVPQDPQWQEAWRITEESLRLINQEVKSHGATFLLLTLSNAKQVHPNPEERQAYAERLGVSDLFYPDHRIQSFARQEQIPFFMLSPILASWAENHQSCVHGFDNAQPCDGHWNVHGHHVAGESIANYICDNIL